MGITKTELFTTHQNTLALMAKVLGHPARIAILEYLLNSKQCVNGQLVDEIGLAQATISQHLRELKQAGLIQGNIDGASICYCIDPKKWNEINELFTQFFQRYNHKNHY